jgi:hypothetical protein
MPDGHKLAVQLDGPVLCICYLVYPFRFAVDQALLHDGHQLGRGGSAMLIREGSSRSKLCLPPPCVNPGPQLVDWEGATRHPADRRHRSTAPASLLLRPEILYGKIILATTPLNKPRRFGTYLLAWATPGMPIEKRASGPTLERSWRLQSGDRGVDHAPTLQCNLRMSLRPRVFSLPWLRLGSALVGRQSVSQSVGFHSLSDKFPQQRTSGRNPAHRGAGFTGPSTLHMTVDEQGMGI